MKKNILTILILAATLVNVTLSAVCVFVVMPANNKANNILKKLTSLIEMEVSGESLIPVPDSTTVPISDQEIIVIENSEIDIVLLPDEAGKVGYAKVSFDIILNKEDETYADTKTLIESFDSVIIQTVTEEIEKYTAAAARTAEGKAQIRTNIVSSLQAKFESTSIIDIAFSKFQVP